MASSASGDSPAGFPSTSTFAPAGCVSISIRPVFAAIDRTGGAAAGAVVGAGAGFGAGAAAVGEDRPGMYPPAAAPPIARTTPAAAASFQGNPRDPVAAGSGRAGAE
jgi:hypothetical protein